MEQFATAMPYVEKMQERLSYQAKDGARGLRLFVQRSSDLTEDDIAHDYLVLENKRVQSPFVVAIDL